MRAVLMLAALAIACDAPGENLDADATPELDAAVLADAGPMVEVDAGELDAGRPALDARVGEPDAGPVDERDAGPIVEGDAGPQLACNPYPHSFDCRECGPLNGMPRTCRLLTDGTAECQIAGNIREHNPGPVGNCSKNTDCGCGLFCNWGRCVRHCDPSGEPCPDTQWGASQRCVQNDVSGLWYCDHHQ